MRFLATTYLSDGSNHFFLDGNEVSREKYEKAMKKHDYSEMFEVLRVHPSQQKCCLHPDEKSFHKGGE